MTALGDCYKVAWHLVTEEGADDMTLCHGEVTGTGGKARGLRYGHAWVEVDGCAIDRSNGNDVTLKDVMYYAAGSIDEEEITRYTAEEARIHALRTGNYGPWEEA